MNDKDIDCEGTYQVICPYCGYEIPDSYEYIGNEDRDGEESNVDCPDCGKTFIIHLHIDYSFDSRKPLHEWYRGHHHGVRSGEKSKVEFYTIECWCCSHCLVKSQTEEKPSIKGCKGKTK